MRLLLAVLISTACGLRVTPPRAMPPGAEVLKPHTETALDLVLPGVWRVPHTGAEDAAYLVEADDGAVLVGVPDKAALPALAEAHEVTTWFLPHTADGAAQSAVREALPEALRVVHRLDAGRGPHRLRSDRLLSAAGARTRWKASDVGKGEITVRPRDDGPWDVAGGRAMWTPGPSLGASVLRVDVNGARVLFSGRLAGFDPRADATSAFATEADHSAAAAGKSLFALAEMDESWDFEWLLPSRGQPVRFASATDARDALRAAARRASSMARAGAG